jgi:hypothetical protein
LFIKIGKKFAFSALVPVLCGTGTVGTVTFCLSRTRTVINYGSGYGTGKGTGAGTGTVIKWNYKR